MALVHKRILLCTNAILLQCMHHNHQFSLMVLHEVIMSATLAQGLASCLTLHCPWDSSTRWSDRTWRRRWPSLTTTCGRAGCGQAAPPGSGPPPRLLGLLELLLSHAGIHNGCRKAVPQTNLEGFGIVESGKH